MCAIELPSTRRITDFVPVENAKEETRDKDVNLKEEALSSRNDCKEKIPI